MDNKLMNNEDKLRGPSSSTVDIKNYTNL